MSTDTPGRTPKNDDTLGISFGAIHSDEPHEAITPQKMTEERAPTAGHDKPPSHLSSQGQSFNVTRAFESDHIEAGTIVSDKKRSRPGLMANIRLALEEWWGGARQAFENTVDEMPRPTKVETPVVAKAETRTEVVKKAAEMATIAPKDDHKVVVQKIRTFTQDVARITGTPVVVRESGVSEPGWTNAKEKEEKRAEQLTPPAPMVTKVDLRHATIAPPIPKKTEIKIPPPPKSSHPTPTTVPEVHTKKPEPVHAQVSPLPASPSVLELGKSKTASIVVPPTVTKKVFTPPQSSITAIAPIKNERKIVSAPIAPSWHHIESTADTATEKPHMYTKKDFTAPEAPKVAPVQKFKFDLSSLKPEPVSVPTEKREIHESLSTPPTADVQKMQEVLTTFVEHTKHETPAPTHKVVVAPKPVIPSAVKQQTEQRPIMVPEAPVSQKEIPTPVSNVAPAVAPVPVTPPAPPVSVPKKVEPPILAEEPVRREPLPVRAPERTPVSVPPSTLPTGEPTPEIVQRRTPEPPPQIQEVAKFVPKPSPAVVPQTFGTESVQTTEAPQRSVPQQAPQAPTKEAEQIPALFQNPLFRRFAKWAVLGLIAIIGVTLAVVLSIYFNVFAPNEEINSEVLTIPSFFNTQTQAGIPLEGDSETFMKNLHEKLSGATSNTQIYPTQKEGEGFRIATAPEFLTFIGSNMNQKTKRALAEIIMIGSVQAPEAEPFIMVRSYNFDSLFAGFLAWEQYMYADLAPLFGTDPIPNPQFKDAVRGNASTRILYDSEGKEIMLYSFVNQNTVVITSSGEALAKIIEEL